ncbi:uncharacterized protein LOC141670772 [Apium graveolens]|uniref:uncharacterized protein LOC141670772 n=1 Tax=Apium graveolens TaxID=4045 RepID=UPI003D7B40A3
MIFRFIVLFSLFLTTSDISVYAFPGNETDQHALLSFKDSVKADPFGALDSWDTSIHFCHWNGVICSTRRQRVTSLNLSSQSLVGTLSPHIGNLSFLRKIYIHENEFHGSIPNEIGRLFRLRHLSLTSNYFQGEFPTNLSQCVDIRNILVMRNNLEGKLPTEFAYWPKLYSFNLANNNFTGSIPSSIGNISSLHFLRLSNNNLEGLIPLQVAHHTNLEYLDMTENSLSGMFPLPLYNLSSLSYLLLTRNKLEGSLPANLGYTLPKLQRFYIGMNRFSGRLPPSIANASQLAGLDILVNSITGPIPKNLGSLSKLDCLNLGFNPLGDSMPPNDLSFFNSLVNCTLLDTLTFANSGLKGEFPKIIVNLSSTMDRLSLYGNHIYGSIPPEIGKLVNLTTLSLGNNLLTGTIPESVGELAKIGSLTFSKNNISGVIPTSISNMTRLVELYLQDNMLQGVVPTELFKVSSLQRLSLANNRLGSVIPEEIVLSSKYIYLNLSRNQFNGSLPSNIGNLNQLVQLDVSYNKLTGDIPNTLDGCVMLEELHMEGNLLQGNITSSLRLLKSLRVLDLSSNNISGNIPRFFEKLHLIEFLNLSHNKLGGEVPGEGLFSNVSAFSVVGNLELCGGIQALHLHACPVKVSRNKKKEFSLRLLLILVLVPLGILFACLAFICYRRRNSKNLNDPDPVLHDSQYLKLSYQDLLLATNKFSPNNLLGEGRYGSVYRGVLESVDQLVAVKVLNVEVRGADKSFLAECETLRNIRHRNLIKIITTCSSSDLKGNEFKALVLEFMTNGSLDNWLHPSPHLQGKKRNLTLLQRINISIDIAMGVDYLHHHTHAGIVHCDLKPSNILLDENFVARIGDFGLARFCFAATTGDINQANSSSTGVRGTVGYVPPEYGLCGEISREGDVYSYGILLLEMFSGKKPTESSISIDGGSNLHDYVRAALPERVMDIVDPRIVLDQEEDGLAGNQSYSRATLELCLTSIFEVGIFCSEETPKKRIDISFAIKQLQAARDKLLQCKQLSESGDLLQ